MNEEQQSGHHFRVKGKNAEAFVSELASTTFLIDWCFPNPHLPNGKELCDLLVVFEHTAIIWQVKNAKLKRDGTLNVRATKKNLRQLSRARRQIFEIGTPIVLANARRHPEILNPSKLTEAFLVSALVGEMPEIFDVPTEIGTHAKAVGVRPSFLVFRKPGEFRGRIP